MGTQTRARGTLSDVAERAGVSNATVSRVINGHPRVRDITRQRVEAAIADVDYAPNLLARQLNRRTAVNGSGAIGLVFDAVTPTAFPADLLRGAMDAASEAGVLLVTASCEPSDLPGERRLGDLLRGWQVDRLIYASSEHAEVEPPEFLTHRALVLANCCDRRQRWTSVMADHVQGGRVATKLLLDAGHRRILFVGTRSPTSQARLAGYRQALTASGVGIDHRLILDEHTAPNQCEPGRPSAAVIAGPGGAAHARRALGQHERAAPDDIPLVVFEDARPGGNMPPALATVAVPHYEIGQRAVSRLLAAEAQELPEQRKTALPCRIEAPCPTAKA